MELNRPTQLQLRPRANIAGECRGAKLTDVLTAPEVKGRILLTVVCIFGNSANGTASARPLGLVSCATNLPSPSGRMVPVLSKVNNISSSVIRAALH